MNINANCRALQHLLVQNFTLYTCPAAVALRLVAPPALEGHAWAVQLDHRSGPWCEQLKEDDPWRQTFIDAANLAGPKVPFVLCHRDGQFLACQMKTQDVRHVMARLEVAKNLDVVPTSLEGLVAVPDEVLEQEVRRRKKETAKLPVDVNDSIYQARERKRQKLSGAKEGQST